MAAAIRLSQQHSCSFNHLVGELLEMQRHFEAERSGSFEVNSEYEFCREFDRQVAWLRAL
jgi:hypothetical protein